MPSDPAPRVKECFEGGGPDQRPGWWISFAYDETWIELLKAMVPARDRAWDATQKRWWVAKECEGTLRRILPGVVVYIDQKKLPI